MLANIPDVTPLAALLLLFVCVTLFVMCSKRKDRALAVAFAVAFVGISLFLLYFLVVPQ